MLVLSRKIGERIVVPDGELTITVLAVRGNTVRLGISAPADVNVYREELWVRMGQPALDSHAEKDQQAKGRS
jgi:carbon storage regulator